VEKFGTKYSKQTKMLELDFYNHDIALCLFIKHNNKEFVVLAIYVDGINIFGMDKLTTKIIETL
jgi:hypothetical protein